jgi:hypothetical protein
MMMKLLPLVAQAIAERRFLAAKKTDARFYGGDLIFDKEVSGTDHPVGNVMFYAEGTTKISAVTTANCRLAVGQSSAVSGSDATAPSADQLKKRRQPKQVGGTAWTLTAADTDVPSCDNTFYQSGDASDEKKAGQNPSDDPTGAASASLSVKFAYTAIAAADLAADKHLLYFCRHASNCAKGLTSGSVYKIKTSTAEEVGGSTGTMTHSAVTLDNAAGTTIKGSDTTSDLGVKTALWFMAAADKDGPKSVTLCATGKGSSTRSAAFVAGLMAYAMLM